jgi:hypothetical protein
MMTETLSWVEADRRDTAVANLFAKLTQKNQSVENGGCGSVTEVSPARPRRLRTSRMPSGENECAPEAWRPLRPEIGRRRIGVHPHVIGQPFRIRALQDFIAYAKGFGDVWFATREEIVRCYLKNDHTHIF